ncbi:MAG: hypothetical protein N3E40_05865 [Dehalococcoidia bacterium]|nr:hypothetical protein [Dehalococcoidia bacterium]
MKRLRITGIVVGTLLAVLVPAQAVMAASSVNVTIQVTPGKVSIDVSPTTYNFGTIAISETWYGLTSPTQTEPSYPLAASSCPITVTNTGNISIKVRANMGNLTYSGEPTWTSSAAAGTGAFRMDIAKDGDSSWTGPINSTTEFISSLAARASKKFALKFQSPTDDASYEGINVKTGTLVISAVKA